MENVNLTQMSAAELEKLLAQKRKEELEERKRKQKEYEEERDDMIEELIKKAQIINELLKEFKTECFVKIQGFKQKAEEYGEIRKTSKGGYGLRNKRGNYMVKYERNMVNEFDERADMGLELIGEFLKDKVKKRDQQMYMLVSKLLTRNKAGDLNVSRVIQLIDLRNEFDDERWLKGIQLLEESYRDRQVSYGISFYEKNEITGKDEQLLLNFTAIKLDIEDGSDREEIENN